MKKLSKKPLVQSLERALDILEHIASRREPVRSVDVAEGLGLNVNTASNLLRTLYQRGYLAQDTGRRYILGSRCFEIGVAADRWANLRESALPVLTELSVVTGDLSFLGVFDSLRLFCVAMVEGGGAVTVSAGRGWEDKAHCSATGKVLLAYLDEKVLEKYLRTEKMQKFTDKTICSPDLLGKELEKVRTSKFAVCCDEASEGVSAVAVPVFDRAGRVIASLGQSFPSYFMESGKINVKSRISLLNQKSGKIGGSISSGDFV